MVVLESCPKHNMVAYLEKTVGNAEFHEVIDFLAQSSIHNALTVCPVVSNTFVEQFWMSAKSKIINNVRYITAKVAGKPVSISEASIRSDLLFNDVDGIDSLPNQAIFDAIQLMGYEGDLTVLTFNKALHLDAKKKFVMYPRFISIFLDKQLMNVPVPLDHFPVNALTSKVFSFMVKKGKHFSGKVTPLFASMLVQPTEDEGATSKRSSKPQPTPSLPHPSEANVEPQSDPSPRPSPTTHIPDSIPESSGGNHGGHSSSDKSLSGNEGDMTLQSVYDLCISLCTQSLDEECLLEAKIGRKEVLEETVDAKGVYMGRSRCGCMKEKEREEKEVSTEDVVSTDKEEKVSTDRSKVSTDKSKVSTDKIKRRSATPNNSTPTLTILEDVKPIAQVLLPKHELKPEAVSTQRRFLAEQRAIAIRNKPPTRTQDEKGIREYEGVKGPDQKSLKKRVIEETPKKETQQRYLTSRCCDRAEMLKIVTFEGTIDSEIMERKSVIARLNKVSSPDGDYLVIYRANGNFRAFNYWEIVTWRLYEACGVYILELKDGTVIHMLVERRYPLSKDLLQRMLDLGLEVERESTVALDLIRFIKQQIGEE
ncbi:hypothetical protein Tco_1193335 [Tanacetum coccineum]